MSKLLINEQPLQFLPTLAKVLGNSDKALILQQIQYWLNNPKVGKEADGRKWIRNTVEEWHKQFPWIASKTVQRYLKDLEGKGYDPRKLLAPGAEAIKDMVITKIKLFGSEGKADE